MIRKIIKFFKRTETTDYYWAVRNKIRKPKNKLSKYFNIYLHNKLMLKNNARIPYSVEIGGKPCFPHGLNGIFISLKAKIGKNCVIFHQVTIGSNTLDSSKNCGAPNIGDNVFIGCGAKIIGGVTIGDNVRIGANCVVVEDVPPNSTVVMGKPRIILHNDKRDNTFVPICDYYKQ